MRRTEKSREEMLKEIRHDYDQKDAFLWPGKRQYFSRRVDEDMASIREIIENQKKARKKDPRYDLIPYGKQYELARRYNKYTQEEVATLLSCASHSFIASLETKVGLFSVDLVILEALSFIYHVEPKTLLCLKNPEPQSVLIDATGEIDQCINLILNILFDPYSIIFLSEQGEKRRQDYIKALKILASLRSPAVRQLITMLQTIPALHEVYDVDYKKHRCFQNASYGSCNTPPSWVDTLVDRGLGVDHIEVLSALHFLQEHNPTWLVFLARLMAAKPESSGLLVDIINIGKFPEGPEARRNLSKIDLKKLLETRNLLYENCRNFYNNTFKCKK